MAGVTLWRNVFAVKRHIVNLSPILYQSGLANCYGSKSQAVCLGFPISVIDRVVVTPLGQSTICFGPCWPARLVKISSNYGNSRANKTPPDVTFSYLTSAQACIQKKFVPYGEV